jgi:hypothetical protein
MNKHKLLISSLISAAVISSCNKDNSLLPVKSTKEQKQYQLTRETGLTNSRQVETMEGSQKLECPWDPGKCNKKKPNIAEDQYASGLINAEIEKIDNIIQTTGSANSYFQTDNWQFLFGEVEDDPTLLNRILTNQIHFYKFATNDQDVAVAYVLSTAQDPNNVTTQNIEVAWEY